jgi:hypothetical protein
VASPSGTAATDNIVSVAREPVSILSYRVDPSGVLALVEQLAPAAVSSTATTGATTGATAPMGETVGEGTWSVVEVHVAAGGSSRVLTLTHSSDDYDGPSWPESVRVLREQCKRFPPTVRTAEVMRALSCVRFRIDLGAGCVVDLDRPDLDEGAALVLALAQHLDAMLLTPSTLRDRWGRVLIGDEAPDPAAVLPAGSTTMPSLELRASLGPDPRAATSHDPTPERVARRALALAAVSSRAFLEQMDADRIDVFFERAKLLAWVDAVNLGDELEPDEWQLLQAQVGDIEHKRAVDCAWRLEGLTVLAWALGRIELPPYDRLVRPAELFPAIRFLEPDALLELQRGAALPSTAEVEVVRRQLFTIHWRIRELRLTGQALDLATAPLVTRAGLLDFSGCRLVDGDLAVGRLPIDVAPAEHVRQTANIVAERLVALRWLLEGATYSHLSLTA